MAGRVPYDDFADIYDVWCESTPITRDNRGFYVSRLVDCPGPAVELGVGNGRICIEAAKQGKEVVGVDSSEKILALCRSRALEAGVSHRIELIHADFRDFALTEPAELVTLPFHAIGHLLTREDKRKALDNIRAQLVDGGQLILDHFVFDPDYPQESGVPHLRAEFRDAKSGRDCLLWEATTRDLDNRVLRIIVWTDDIDAGGTVVCRRYRRINLSWIPPEDMEDLLVEVGFEITDAYGDFHGTQLGPDSTHQIWIATRG